MKNIEKILENIRHPETGESIISLGIVDNISVKEDKITVTLKFKRNRDPFALSIKKQVEESIRQNIKNASVSVFIKEGAAAAKNTSAQSNLSSDRKIHGVDKIIAIASGKGGVGKSTVTANLAVELSEMGYKVGILDADIYGPSQPKMFGMEGYVPEAIEGESEQMMIPAESHRIKIMSIGFFIKPQDALIWRGPMATSALSQLLRQSQWGLLDFLLIDMPPGTGDIHLAIVQQLSLDGAIIVSTPQQVAVADVRRGVEMFRTKGIEVPVLGIIENMSWFTPKELPQNRYYIFGKGGAEEFAKNENIDFLGDIPIIQSIMESGDEGIPAVEKDNQSGYYYKKIAEKIVDKCK